MRLGSLTVRTKAIIIQVAIVAGVILWFKLALPSIRKERVAAEAVQREEGIESFVQSVVVEAGRPEAEASLAPGERPARPQRLRIFPPVDEVQQALGAPSTSMTDFRGGQHLTWIGTRHSLEVSFDKGRLYALTLTDLESGHGATIHESPAFWRQF